jgi:tryptophan synthase beta chain
MKNLDQKKYFGQFGGAYVPEMLYQPLKELEQAFNLAQHSKVFNNLFKKYLKDFAGRPTPLIFAENFTRKLGGAKIYLKNEGANHTGAHKITHCIGQSLIARNLGKKELIAETGAGQHGIATATVAAKFGFACKVFMGKKDIARQRPNVFWMKQLGAEVISVNSGSQTLKDAVNEALKYWMANTDKAHYVLGSVLGPHPYPLMNRTFQAVVGKEIKAQLNFTEGKLPDLILACVGGGSNAMGAFYEFIKNKNVRLIGVEAGGSSQKIGQNAIRSKYGRKGILQGYKSIILQDKEGQIAQTHSIAAGLDYPGLGPELAELYSSGRVNLVSASDSEAINASQELARLEGIISALESAHAVAVAIKIAPKMKKNQIIVVNVSGRGDKDIFNFARAVNDKDFKQFLIDEVKRYPSSNGSKKF